MAVDALDAAGLATPSVSVVIPTVGRSTLGRAVSSALSQSGTAVEVIVANDSGWPLEAMSELADPRVHVLDTHRIRQSAARNAGAAAARGSYLLFLDDDDWLAPGGVGALLRQFEADRSIVAAYGAAALVDASGSELARVNLARSGNCSVQTLAGASIQTGSALIDPAAFRRIGGFNTDLPNGDDIYLFRVLSALGDFGNCADVVVNVTRGAGWSTMITQEHPILESVRTSRETVLDQPGIFGRLRDAADTPYWMARLLKAYAASCYWNLKHRRPTHAINRALHFLRSAAAALPSTIHGDFWRAWSQTQVPSTFQRALETEPRH